MFIQFNVYFFLRFNRFNSDIDYFDIIDNYRVLIEDNVVLVYMELLIKD